MTYTFDEVKVRLTDRASADALFTEGIAKNGWRTPTIIDFIDSYTTAFHVADIDETAVKVLHMLAAKALRERLEEERTQKDNIAVQPADTQEGTGI